MQKYIYFLIEPNLYYTFFITPMSLRRLRNGMRETNIGMPEGHPYIYINKV